MEEDYKVPLVLVLTNGDKFTVPFGSVGEALMNSKGDFVSAKIVKENTGEPAEVLAKFGQSKEAVVR